MTSELPTSNGAGRNGLRRLPVHVSRGCLVISLQGDLDDELLEMLRRDLLEGVRMHRTRGVILDLSGVEVLDSEDFGALRKTLEMASLMGARSVVVGLRAPIVSALVQLGADVDGLLATAGMDAAFDLLDPPASGSPEGAPAEPDEELPDEEETRDAAR